MSENTVEKLEKGATYISQGLETIKLKSDEFITLTKEVNGEPKMITTSLSYIFDSLSKTLEKQS